jgi:hypothetical protein
MFALRCLKRRAVFLQTGRRNDVLRIGLATFGLGVVLASPLLDTGDSRFAMLVEMPWQSGHAVEAGRKAGGLLVRTGPHIAMFYFPEGVAMPAWSNGVAVLPLKATALACSQPG